jgi:hypothetical protein
MRSRSAIIGSLVVACFAIGFAGQGHWRIGARPASAAVSAVALEAIGGSGGRQPVRVLVSIAVLNEGADPIRVLGTADGGAGVDPISLDPLDLSVDGGQVGRLNATLALDCRAPHTLRLPDVRIARLDAVRHTIAVGGSGLLLEACARSASRTRPLAITNIRQDGGQLVLDVSSPTGRPARISAVRAGGVPLPAADLPLDVVSPATVRLDAPRGCPREWLVGGIPSTVDVDLATPPPTAPPTTAPPTTGAPTTGAPTTAPPTTATASGPARASPAPSTHAEGMPPVPVATLQLSLGSPLVTWLLDTACRSRA